MEGQVSTCFTVVCVFEELPFKRLNGFGNLLQSAGVRKYVDRMLRELCGRGLGWLGMSWTLTWG